MPKIYGTGTSSTSVGGGLSAAYTFSNTTTEADPGNGKVRLNNAAPASVTAIYISKIDADGFSREGLELMRFGDAILLNASKHSTSQAYQLTAAPIDNTTWIKLLVTNELTNGSFPDNAHIEVTAIFSGASAYTELSDTPNSFTGDAGKLLAVNSGATAVEHRVLTSTDIPSLDAAKITSGTFTTTQIPSLDAAKITTGTLNVARIPNLDASKITTGVFDVSEIPSLPASRITTETIATARLGSGTANNTTYLRGDQTWASIASGVVTVQSAAPILTTNGTLGALIYATSVNRLYVCIDATTNANVWSFWNRDGDSLFSFITTGSPVNNTSMDGASNQAFFRNGALYYIGTSGLTTAYSNVHTSGRVLVTMSGVSAGSATLLMDRTQQDVYTPNTAGSWIRFDFGSRTFAANRIVWQHGYNTSEFRLQNYKYQGSNDASTSPTNWTDIVTYTASPPAASAYSYKDDSFTNTTEYRHYRVLSTGVDTIGMNFVMMSDIEFYGKAINNWTF